MALIDSELSEPYSIFTYRYFINNWRNLCFLARALPAAHGPRRVATGHTPETESARHRRLSWTSAAWAPWCASWTRTARRGAATWPCSSWTPLFASTALVSRHPCAARSARLLGLMRARVRAGTELVQRALRAMSDDGADEACS